MPIYEYRAKDDNASCEYCRDGFDVIQRLSEAGLLKCPKCGAPVLKQISAPSVGTSKSGFDDRAKSAGFTKLKRIGKGEYEKQY